MLERSRMNPRSKSPPTAREPRPSRLVGVQLDRGIRWVWRRTATGCSFIRTTRTGSGCGLAAHRAYAGLGALRVGLLPVRRLRAPPPSVWRQCLAMARRDHAQFEHRRPRPLAPAHHSARVSAVFTARPAHRAARGRRGLRDQRHGPPALPVSLAASSPWRRALAARDSP
jgi:hypothetical protein